MTNEQAYNTLRNAPVTYSVYLLDAKRPGYCSLWRDNLSSLKEAIDFGSNWLKWGKVEITSNQDCLVHVKICSLI